MARKKRHGRRGPLVGLKRKAGSLAGTAVQLFGMLHGLISGVSRARGNPADIPAAVVFDYSGYDINNGGFDQNTAVKSGSILLVTYLVGAGIKWVARH